MKITNIRRARKNAGLQPQHLTAVMAAASIAGAEVQGAEGRVAIRPPFVQTT